MKILNYKKGQITPSLKARGSMAARSEAEIISGIMRLGRKSLPDSPEGINSGL